MKQQEVLGGVVLSFTSQLVMPTGKHGQRTPRLSVFCLLLLFISVSPGPSSALFYTAETQPLNVTLTYLRSTLKALEGALSFFQSQYTLVNLDSVIGTRMVEGSLKVLLTNLRRKNQIAFLPEDVTASIDRLYHTAKRVSDDTEPHVAVNQPVYYRRIGPAIQEGLWELDYPRRTLSMEVPVWTYVPIEAMTEKESDDCLTELFGTSGKTDEKCVISDKCWDAMTKLGYSMYSLSHEIFYLQLAELTGCQSEMMWKIAENIQPGLRVLQDTFCANMLREAQDIAHDGFPGLQQDLFMEQAALCGLYGYWEFFHLDWLDTILGWQDHGTGCYRWAGWSSYYLAATGHHIRKREERQLDNGCLCHRTTVAAGALVQYVRYLSEVYLGQVTTNSPLSR